MPIHYFSEDIDFHIQNPDNTSHWIKSVISDHSLLLKEINYIFCSDDYLLDINQTHLKHDFYTDIITFDHSESKNEIQADIFISVDRVKENASERKLSFDEELNRVMIHGILHLLGYNDHTDEEKSSMRRKEDACLSLRKK